ncbi:MAG: ABC transporter permease subunit [Acidobacteria bacterium]|nr:ABC transporter permease subunit [Acidobacteriota bacterium]
MAPTCGVLAGLFAGGFGVAIAQSLGLLSPIGEDGPNLNHYIALVDDREFRQSLWQTLTLAGVTTALAAVFGTVLALSVRRLVSRYRLMSALIQIPLAIPHLSMAIFLITLIAPSGLLARLTFAGGLIAGSADFPLLINDQYGVGIVLSYLLKEVPFVAVVTLSVIVRLGDRLEEVAQLLGATGWQRLRYVTIPLLAPAALSASLMVFAFVVGAYETPRLLGQTWPGLLPVIAQQRYMDTDLSRRPGAIAMAVVLSSLTGLLVWAYLRLTARWTGAERTIPI